MKVAGQLESDHWQPLRPDRWIAEVPTRVRYGRRFPTLALKWYTPSDSERYALLLHTLAQLSPAQVAQLDEARGGIIEPGLKQDKLSLQLLRRRKRCWHAQEAGVILRCCDGDRHRRAVFDPGYGGIDASRAV